MFTEIVEAILKSGREFVFDMNKGILAVNRSCLGDDRYVAEVMLSGIRYEYLHTDIGLAISDYNELGSKGWVKCWENENTILFVRQLATPFKQDVSYSLQSKEQE